MCARAGGCGQKLDDTTCRLCGTDTETVVHAVLHYPALAAKEWPALLSFSLGLGLNRDDTDEGTVTSYEHKIAKRFY